MAASSLANIVKSSLGPLGLDKMLVDDIGVIKLIAKIKIIKSLKFKQILNRMLQLQTMEPLF